MLKKLAMILKSTIQLSEKGEYDSQGNITDI